MTPELLVRRDSRVLTLELNRPHKRNALNGALVQALRDALLEAETEENVRVILLRGAGPDFCAGADLEELERMASEGPEASARDARRLGDLFLEMRNHPRPIIAGVHGRALAGGCGLATACDLVVASDNAEFGYPEVHLGFVPAMVMAILRQKMGEGQAFELVSLGHRISARDAANIGLVNRILDSDAFDRQVREFAEDLAARPPEALTLIKELLYEQADLSFQGGIRRGEAVNVEARQTDACRKGVQEFLTRRRTRSE